MQGAVSQDIRPFVLTKKRMCDTMATKNGAGGEPQEYDTSTGRYGSGRTFRQNTPYHIISNALKHKVPIDLSDEQLPRSVGAKWINCEISLPDGRSAHFVEGTKLQNKEIIAGLDHSRKIDCIERLVSTYGGKADTWAKVKAFAEIEYPDGETEKVEVHWYEEPSIGKVEFKRK